MEQEKDLFLQYDDIEHITDISQILGLSFPKSGITDFQKAMLTLAHLMASLREQVLKGNKISNSILALVCSLCDCIADNGLNQLPEDE